MGKLFEVRLVKNKKNGQLNFSLPKKKISKKFLSDLNKAKVMKISIEKLKW